MSSERPQIGVPERLFADLHRPVGLEVDVAMRRAMQKAVCRLRLEKRWFSVLGAVCASVERFLGRAYIFLVAKHNAAALRGVRYPTFPVIKALHEFGNTCLKGQVLCLQRHIFLNEALVLRNQERIRVLCAKHVANPLDGAVKPLPDGGGIFDGGYGNAGRCGPGDDLLPIHEGSPNVEKGCVRTPDSTLRGNCSGEGA